VAPVKGSVGSGLKVKSDGTRTLTNGVLVRVRVLSVLPSEACPIYLADNPVNILSTIWTATSIAFKAAACTALKADPSIGNDAYAALRITSPQSLSVLAGNIQRPFGIGIRANSAGELVPFQGRVVPNTPPTKTITSANVAQGSTHLPFELDPAQAVQTIAFRQKRFADAVNDMPGQDPVDRVRETDDELTLINGDATAIAFGSFDLSTEAMLHVANAKYPVVEHLATAIAQGIFDRWGHGPIALETTLIRGTAVGGGLFTEDIVLGEELLINLPELPNANYRLGDNPAIAARAMQVVRLTEKAEGYDIRVVDSGPNAQPLTTVPTLSIAASTDLPRTVALVTITNAAALNALGYGARIQWGMTMNGTAPNANQFTDLTTFPAGAIPTGAFRLSPADAGATIYVQGRSEKRGGAIVTAGAFVVGAQYTIISVGTTSFTAIGAASNTIGVVFTATGVGSGTGTASNFARPSNYGSTAHLTLSAVSNPTSVTATPNGSDASLCTIAWSIGSGATGDYSDIYLRLSGQTFDQARRIGTVDPGSTRFVLEMLTASTNYIASVQHRDPTTQDKSDPVDVAFTSGSTLRALFAPFNPFGFAGSQDAAGVPQKDGVYGLAVVAGDFPGFVEFAVATETAVASGTYGAFVTMTKIPSVSGGWTVASFLAPQDGLRRQIKARQVGDGLTSSSYTTAVTVTPWTPIGLPAFAAGAQGTVTVDADGLWVAIADGPGATQSWLYATSTSAPPTDATVLASGSTVSGRTFTLNAVTALAFGGRIYITAIPLSGPSGTGVPIAPSMHLVGAYLSYQSTTTVLLAASAFKPSADLNVAGHAYAFDLNSGGALRNKGTAADSYDFSCGYQIPQGCTISVFGEHAYSNPARGVGHTATVALTLFQLNSDGSTTGLGNRRRDGRGLAGRADIDFADDHVDDLHAPTLDDLRRRLWRRSFRLGVPDVYEANARQNSLGRILMPSAKPVDLTLASAVHAELRAVFDENAAPSHVTRADVHAQLQPILVIAASVQAQVAEYRKGLVVADTAPHDTAIDPKLQLLHNSLNAMESRSTDLVRVGRELALAATEFDRVMAEAAADLLAYSLSHPAETVDA
jgi:hypothetical protein